MARPTRRSIRPALHPSSPTASFPKATAEPAFAAPRPVRLLDVGFVPAIHDDANSTRGNSSALQFRAPPLRQFERRRFRRAHDKHKLGAPQNFLGGVIHHFRQIDHDGTVARACKFQQMVIIAPRGRRLRPVGQKKIDSVLLHDAARPKGIVELGGVFERIEQ
jgi:hypothetical protein